MLVLQEWLLKELENVPLYNIVELIENLRRGYLDYVVFEPVVKKKLPFHPTCPKLARHFFQSCSCPVHVWSPLAFVQTGSPVRGMAQVGSAALIQPLQLCVMSNSLEKKFFNDSNSSTICVELVDGLEIKPCRQVTNPEKRGRKWQKWNFSWIAEGLQNFSCY